MKADALWKAFTSLQFTIACLAALMVLVTACTLAQVHLGTYGAVKTYIRAPFIYWRGLPIFPGGGLVGALLLVNLVVSQFNRLERSRRKAGLWVIHFGMILLFLGEFVTGFWQVETTMPLDEGATKSYAEDFRHAELVVIDETALDRDEVFAIGPEALARRREFSHPRLPFTVKVKRWFPNSTVERGVSPANRGVGLRAAAYEAPPAASDDANDQPSAYVELEASGKSLGVWLLSTALGAPQSVAAEGRSFRLALRPVRRYLPYSLTLKDFKHDVYPGTDIPRNFSSLVRLNDPERSQDRDVLIYMNSPLRYRGSTFFQSSFGKQDTMSVLLVVSNPGWLLPYLACVLVSLGLLLHFAMRFKNS